MKITLSNKKELLECLAKVNSVVEKRNTLQILSNVLLHAKGDSLTIKATDLEVSIEAVIPVQTLVEGKATVSAKNFFDIVKELPEKEISIHSKENHWIGIQCGKSNFNILGLAPEDFPALPNNSTKNTAKANAVVFSKMIDHTLYAVSNDETRYQLNGVYLESKDGKKHRMVAIDGHRLAMYEDVLFESHDGFAAKGMIIPKKGIQEIRKLMDSDTKFIDLAMEGNHLIARTPKTYLSVRLLEGQYPDYNQVIPKANSRTVEIDKTFFLDSLKRVSLLANEKSKGIKLSLTKGKLEISSNNPDIGEATEMVECSYAGENLDIGFNAKYLIDCLMALSESSQISIDLNDKMSPGVVKIPGNNQYLGVLMPMRL